MLIGSVIDVSQKVEKFIERNDYESVKLITKFECLVHYSPRTFGLL